MLYDDSNLTPDLEWMLQSNQGSQLMVIEAVAREYALPIYRLALWLLNDPAAAEDAFLETLIAVPANRHRFSERVGVRNWLLALTIGVCRRYRRSRMNRPVRSLLRAFAGQPPDRARRKVRRAVRKETEVDRQLWRSIDSLGERQRVPLLLKNVLHLGVPDIARVVGFQENAAHSSLRSASRKLFLRLRKRICQLRVSEQRNWLKTLGLRHRRARRLIEARIEAGDLNAEDQRRLDLHLQGCAACRAYALEMVELDGLIQSSLPARWTADDQPDLRVEAVLDRVEAGLGEQRKQGMLLQFVRQAAVGGAAIALVLAISWITNLLFPRSAAPLQQTAAVTRRVSVPATQAAAPPSAGADLLPLTGESGPEEIRRLMTEGSSLWNSIWVEAQVIRYGPDGYIGPPQVYRSQIWIEQPAKKMVLSGPHADDPEYVSFLLFENNYEMDIHHGLTYYTRVSEADRGLLSQNERPAFLGLYGYNTRGILDGSLVLKLLFSGQSIAAAENLHQHGLEPVLDRQALVVDMRLQGSRHRLWVDTETGLVLRWIRFDPQASRQVTEEILITDLSFEAAFPEQSYTSYIFDTDRFVWENEWRPDRPSAAAPTPTLIQPYARDRWLEPLNGARSYRTAEETPTARSSFPFEPPEYGYDLARSRLTFQWRPSLEPGVVYADAQPGELADIFADGRFIGQVSMGNPSNLFCERSPDGSLIAFLDPPLGPEGLYIAREGPFWFNLSDPYQVYNALPNGVVVSSDFAFSPDSRKLAFWGCGGSEQNCGIFLQDTQSGKNIKLLELDHGATFFTWSPDGEYLVFSTAENRLMVVRVSNGEIIYQSEPGDDALDSSGQLESIRPDWSLTFPTQRTGLDGCVEPPVSARRNRR